MQQHQLPSISRIHGRILLVLKGRSTTSTRWHMYLHLAGQVVRIELWHSRVLLGARSGSDSKDSELSNFLGRSNSIFDRYAA